MSSTPTPLSSSTSESITVDVKELRYATPKAPTKPCGTSKKIEKGSKHKKHIMDKQGSKGSH